MEDTAPYVAPESNQRPSPGLYRKSRMNTLGERVFYGKFEPRFKPLGSNNYIVVGCYKKEEDAKACYQILAFLYGKEGARGELPLEDGTTYTIAPVPEEAKCLGQDEKKEWAKKRVKEVLAEYQLLRCDWNPEAHRTANAFPPVLPESPDAGARVIVPGGSIGVQADDAHPLQLGNQGGDLVPSTSPSNYSSNVALRTEGMQHHTFNDTPSDGVGGDEFNFTAPESIARSQPEAETNIATIRTGESNEQPLQPQRPGTPLQGNQANDSAVNIIIDDFSLRKTKCQELHIQLLETRCSSLESQQVQWQSQQQQMENRFLEFQRHQQHLLLEILQLKSRIQEKDSRILELEGANDVLEYTHITRKRRSTCVTPTHDSQN